MSFALPIGAMKKWAKLNASAESFARKVGFSKISFLMSKNTGIVKRIMKFEFFSSKIFEALSIHNKVSYEYKHPSAVACAETESGKKWK